MTEALMIQKAQSQAGSLAGFPGAEARRCGFRRGPGAAQQMAGPRRISARQEPGPQRGGTSDFKVSA